MTNKEILNTFKHSTIKLFVAKMLEDVLNYEIEKSDISNHAISFYKLRPFYCYYDNKEDRDHDYELLMGLVEAKDA
jgi:hypothetical protein